MVWSGNRIAIILLLGVAAPFHFLHVTFPLVILTNRASFVLLMVVSSVWADLDALAKRIPAQHRRNGYNLVDPS